MLFVVLAIVLVISIRFLRMIAGPYHRPLLLVLMVSGLYYGVAGPAYWYYIEDGYFVGMFWNDRLEECSTYIVLFTVYFAAMCVLSTIALKFRDVDKQYVMVGDSVRLVSVFGVIGAVSAAYVTASSLTHGALDRSDPLILICYQFSDILVPVCLYLVATRGLDRVSGSYAAGFFAYAVLVGFRYKLVLLFVPLAFVMFFAEKKGLSGLRRRIGAALVLAVVASVFVMMTLVRKKFSGLDFGALADVQPEDVWYGFFAESNIVFGLIGVMNRYVDVSQHIGIVPLTDSLLELIPRFLVPWRETGGYLLEGATGLMTKEGETSGTAYPFFAEYLMMGGWLFAFFGIGLVALIYRKLIGICLRARRIAPGMYWGGLGLLATFFGYYYFSRGYMPQIVKGFLFVVVPYFMLVANSLHKRSGRPDNRPA